MLTKNVDSGIYLELKMGSILQREVKMQLFVGICVTMNYVRKECCIPNPNDYFYIEFC